MWRKLCVKKTGNGKKKTKPTVPTRREVRVLIRENRTRAAATGPSRTVPVVLSLSLYGPAVQVRAARRPRVYIIIIIIHTRLARAVGVLYYVRVYLCICARAGRGGEDDLVLYATECGARHSETAPIHELGGGGGGVVRRSVGLCAPP